jgi:hypothetical protein
VSSDFAFSPNKSLVLTVRNPKQFFKNDIILWRINNGELVEVVSEDIYEELSHTSYRFLNWKDNSTMLLTGDTRTVEEFCPGALYMTFPATLKVDMNGWGIVKDLSPSSVKCE